MSELNQPQTINSLGDNSLNLGVTSSSLAFLILLISFVAQDSKFIKIIGRVFFIADGLAAFMGFLAVVLGLAGLFGKNMPRSSSVVGLFLGFLGIGLFLVFIRGLR